ncbi:MAG: GntR family transcriptional regulator [Pseudomonadota bacterium]|nr:GntR family transcriptional regulator [Pseudomonadota bacterium]
MDDLSPLRSDTPGATSLADRIAEAIATGEYPPGTRLDEIELAERHGVSRTPVREALIQLGAAGLLTLRPRRGAVVTEVSARQLMEMFEVMAELEAMCARLAARRASAADQQALRAAHLGCVGAMQAGDPDAYYLRNETFHHTLYRIAHHGFLEQQALALSRRLRAYRRLQLRVRTRLSSSFAEHQALVDAVCGGDESAAAQCCREHVSVQGERFADLLASMAAERRA